MQNKFLEVQSLESLSEHKLVRMIDPAEIKYLPRKDFKCDAVEEKASGGDWDKELVKIEDDEVYKSFQDVYFNGKTWNETEMFLNRLEKAGILVESDRPYYKFKRCSYLNYLYQAMRAFGFVQDPNSDLVGICIGRNGEVILNNGRHRVACAKLLGIKSIPVTIDVRHSKWVAFCDSVDAYRKAHGGMLYAPVDHVDLKHLPVRQPDRSGVIIEHMSPAGGSLVDLGAQWGLHAHKLHEYFDYTVAVEGDPTESMFLRKLWSVYEDRYNIAERDAVDFVVENPQWDCVLMMSVLHHIPIEQRDKLFNALNAREMFFQFPSKEELEVPAAAWVRMILNTSCFNRVEQLTNHDREIFHFKR